MLLYFPRLKVFHKRCLPKSLNQNENDTLKFYQPNESEATTFDNKSEQDVVLNISSHSSGSIPLLSPTSEQSVMFSDKLSQDMAFGRVSSDINTSISLFSPQVASFSQHSSTPLLSQEEDNKVEGFAASSFIKYSGYFPEFLPNSATDISSIDSELELTVDRNSADTKNEPQYYLPSEAHSRRVSETCYHNVNEVVQLTPTCSSPTLQNQKYKIYSVGNTSIDTVSENEGRKGKMCSLTLLGIMHVSINKSD